MRTGVRGFPSGPEAILLHQKAGYMYATFLWMPVKLLPCNAGRTIYDPEAPFKHRIDELDACLRLIECAALIGIKSGGEGGHQLFDDFGRAHAASIMSAWLKPRGLYRISRWCIMQY